MSLEKAESLIGAGIGIAALGIGAGIAFDALQSISPQRRKKSYTLSYKPPVISPIKPIRAFKWKL